MARVWKVLSMENIQPGQVLTALGVVLFLCAMLLIWGDRPELAAWIRRLFEARSMPDAEPLPPRTSAEPSEPRAVLAETNRADDELVLEFEDVFEWLRSHKLTSEEAADLFAVARRENGEYFWSANKILEATGGTASEVKAQIAALRPKPPAPRASGRVERPANGWGKS